MTFENPETHRKPCPKGGASAIPPVEPSREDRLLGAFADCLDRLNSGNELKAEDLQEAYPDLATELGRELATFRGIGRPAVDSGGLQRLGDYRIVRQIGRGGMGVVYEAWDETVDRPVALKVLPSELLSDSRAVARFVQEARIAGKLRHPSIVGVYGMGIDRGRPYFVMELVGGRTLKDIVSAAKPALMGDLPEGAGANPLEAVVPLPREPGALDEASPPEERDGGDASGPPRRGPSFGHADASYCRRMGLAFADLADALQHAHRKGVIHRDIKPGNIILDDDGRLRILDFGLARLEGGESLTGSEDVVGTLLYMSPEQARAKDAPLDHRTDVYSLGATLYEVLTFEPPFRGGSRAATINRILSEDPVSLRRWNVRIPRDLETIVFCCLEKDPRNRYATAEALSQDLLRFARGDPIEARPLSALNRLSRRLWRKKARWVAVVSLLLLALATGALLRNHYRTEAVALAKRYDALVLSSAMLLEYARAIPPAKVEISEWVSGAESAERVQQPRGALAFDASADDARLEPLRAALEGLREARRLVPSRPEAVFHTGRALALLGEEAAARELVEPLARGPQAFAPARVWILALSQAGEGEAPEGGQGDGEKAASAAEAGRPAWESTYLAAHRARDRQEWPEVIAAATRLLETLRKEGEPYPGASIEALLLRGVARLRARDLDGALEDFSGARILEPGAVEPVLLIARVYHGKGNLDAALQRLAEFQGTAAFRGEAARRIAAALLDCGAPERALEWVEDIDDPAGRHAWRARCLARLGRKEEAIAEADYAVALEPLAEEPYYVRGLVLLEAREYAEAGDAFGKALQANPRSISALNGLARARIERYEVGAAREAIEKALAAQPRNATSLALMGTCYLTEARYEEAHPWFERALAVDRDNLTAVINEALAYARERNYEEAIRRFQRAVELDDALAVGHSNLGWMYMRTGKYAEARVSCSRALELDPDFYKAWYVIGSSYLREGQLEKALEAYDRGIAIEPKDALGHFDRGVILEAMGRLGEAEASYVRATEAERPDIRAAFNLGNLRVARGRLEEGVAAFERALEIDPDHEPSHTNLCEALRSLGRLEEARLHCLRSIAIDPESPDAYFLLAMVEDLSGNLEGAKARLLEGLRHAKGDPRPLAQLAGYEERGGELAAALESAKAAIEAWEKIEAQGQSQRRREGALGKIDALETASRIAGRLGEGELSRRFCAEALGEWRSLADAEGARPEDQDACARALLLCEPPDLRDPEAALAYVWKAIEAKDPPPEFLETLAMAQFQEGKASEAVATLERALALLPAPKPGADGVTSAPSDALRDALTRRLDDYRRTAIEKR